MLLTASDAKGMIGADVSLEKLIKTDQDFIQVLHVTTIAFLALSVGLFIQRAVRLNEAMSYSAHSPKHVMPDVATQAIVQASRIRQLGRW